MVSYCDRPPMTGVTAAICSLTLQEMAESRRVLESKTGPTYENLYIVSGTDDEQLVRCRIEDDTVGIPRKFRETPLSRTELIPVGNYHWIIRALYAWSGALSVDEAKKLAGVEEGDVTPQMFSFSTIGGSVTLTQNFSQELHGAARDHQGAINFLNGKVNGLDVTDRQFKWSESWLFTYEDITSQGPNHPTIPPVTCADTPNDRLQPETLLDVWYYLTGTINGDPSAAQEWNYGEDLYRFRNWRSGEVLFLGATGRLASNYMVEVTFEFAVSKTKEVCLQSGTGTGGPGSVWVTARGWDYLEYQYGNEPRTTTDSKKHLAPIPIGAIAHQVYLQTDFAALEIGTEKLGPQDYNKRIDPCNVPPGAQEIERAGNWDYGAASSGLCEIDTNAGALQDDILFNTKHAQISQ